MAKIGRLTKGKGSKGDFYKGSMATLQMSLSIELHPNPDKRGSNDPDWRILSVNSDGEEVQIGSGWTKAIRSAARAGEEFISITIDDPSLPSGINAGIFRGENDNEFVIAWRRRAAKSA